MLYDGMLKKDSLKDKTILITGGGTGLGKSMAKYFLSLGANLIIVSRKIDVLEKTAKELNKETGGDILPLQCDVRKHKDVEKILKLSLDGKIPDARNQMIELIKVYGMSETDFLKYLNQSVFNLKVKNLEDVLETIAKYDYRILVGSNPEIQLSALLAEISKFGK